VTGTFRDPVQQNEVAPVFIINPVGDLGPCTVLATRGFWDVNVGLFSGVANLFFGMVVVNEKLLGPREEFSMFEPPDPFAFPDTNGYFVYEPFVRIASGSISQDPPFYSKARRILNRGDVLVGVAAWNLIGTRPPRSVNMGVLGRVLCQH